MHGIIRPAISILLKQSGSSKRKSWKPSIVASQKSFIVLTNAADAKSKIQAIHDKYKEMGLTNQITIAAIGDDKFYMGIYSKIFL